jgi:hypothetical protein
MQPGEIFTYAVLEECQTAGELAVRSLVTRDSFTNYALRHTDLNHWNKAASYMIVWSTIIYYANAAQVPIYGRPSHGKRLPFTTPSRQRDYKGVEPQNFPLIHDAIFTQDISDPHNTNYPPSAIYDAQTFIGIVARDVAA